MPFLETEPQELFLDDGLVRAVKKELVRFFILLRPFKP